MVCFFCLSSLGGSSSPWISPSTRAREKPWVWSCLNSSMYSPLRPRMTGARTWKRAPSSSWSTRSTICCGVCRSIGEPQTGQCGAAGARVEQPEVVVDLGDGADGRAGVLGRRLLVDRHRGRETLDEVDVGLVHLAEELARVRRQRLDVAALALGEDRVERQDRLAGPGQAREDDEGVAWQVERDVLEVVLPGAPDHQLISHVLNSVTRRRVLNPRVSVRTNVRKPTVAAGIASRRLGPTPYFAVLSRASLAPGSTEEHLAEEHERADQESHSAGTYR